MYFFLISRLFPKGDSRNVVTINEYFALQIYSELCIIYLATLRLSRENVSVEVVQATNAIFQETWICKASLEDKQHLKACK